MRELRSSPGYPEVFVLRDLSHGRTIVRLVLDPSRHASGENLVGEAMSEAPRLGVIEPCRSHVTSLRARLGLSNASVRRLSYIDVDPTLRRLGWGTWLYAELARLEWFVRRAVLVPDFCAGGSSSEDALRMWASRGLESFVDRELLAMVWRDRRRALIPPPLPMGGHDLAAEPRFGESLHRFLRAMGT